MIAVVSAALLLAVLAAAPGGASPTYNFPDLRPWRPSLAVRFTGAMLALGQPISDASTHNGRVLASVAPLRADQLAAVRRAARIAARRVERNCRCRLRGYEIRTRVPGRGVQVVAAGP